MKNVRSVLPSFDVPLPPVLTNKKININNSYKDDVSMLHYNCIYRLYAYRHIWVATFNFFYYLTTYTNTLKKKLIEESRGNTIKSLCKYTKNPHTRKMHNIISDHNFNAIFRKFRNIFRKNRLSI